MTSVKGKKTRITASLIFAAMLLMLFSACSGGSPGGSSDTKGDSGKNAVGIEQVELKPAELLIYSIVPSITQEEFERTMAEPVRKKYPNYTLRYVISGKDTGLDKMIASGEAPDITITSLNGLNTNLIPYGLQYDLDPLVKKYNYDVNRFEPATIESMRNATGGKLYGLPKYLNAVVMFYNKDLFDRFGVPYPKDGMTWDEVYDIAVRMTRTVDGAKYRGMAFFYNNMFVENQLSLPFITADGKSNVNTPGFQKLFTTFKRFYDIVGNKPEGNFSADTELTAFHKDKNVAMVMSPLSGYGRFENDPDLNWDIVAAPTFPDKPRVGFQPNTIYYFISNANGKGEQAFQVVAHLSTEEVHALANKEGRATSLKNDALRAAFGQDNPKHKNKNFKAMFFNEFAPTPPTNPELDSKVKASNILLGEFNAMIKNGTDVNTALRTADEKMNQEIVKAKSQ